MKAVVWHGKQDVRVDDVPDPAIREPTDAIVRITSTAICGSDLHLYAKLSAVMREGDILGHEPMGIVEEVGSEVAHIRPGDRVVVPFNVACGRCFTCTQGLHSQCETTQNRHVKAPLSLLGRGKAASLFGYTHLYGAIAGGQAEYLRVPQAHFGPIKVPDGPSDERFLFLSDVLPTAWQAVIYADPPRQGTLLVFGLGPIGQMCCRIARHFGVERVLAVDRVPARLQLARRYGVETIDFEAADSVKEAVLDMTAGRGADAVIDAVGMEAAGSRLDHVLQAVKIQMDRTHALWESMRCVRRGGTLSLTGVYSGPVQMFPLGDLFDMQVQVRMGQANVRRWVDDILPLLLRDDDPLGTEDLTTHTWPLARAPEAYELFQAKRDGAVKVVLRP
ncbi:MAG: glutathione-dependent formaldehyde dehydrogenase [Thermoleophilia bacterium]|nr:glutathione-dependent formaldehyde dehydrogenase [Thermoleophilia bacterium]